MSEYLCKDCVHARCPLPAFILSCLLEFKTPDSCFYKCVRTLKDKQTVIDPVVGKIVVKPKMNYCSTERSMINLSFSSDFCGPDAKHWLPKKKKDIFRLLKKENND